jgi:LPXTG-motif cell wall-anchored protein
MRSISISRLVLAVAAIAGLTVGVAWAQTTSSSTETKKFEVIAVDGNDLVVKLPEGTRQLTVPEDFRFTVNGKQLSVHELKPGMAGTATITTRTTTTPVTVTEVKGGTVAHVAGSTLIVRTDEGFRSFSQSEIDKRGVKIFRSGTPAQLSDFRTGDRLSATIVTTMPPMVVTEKEVQATVAASAAAAPPATRPAATAPGAPAAGSSARTLPKTGGSLPLVGFVGLTSLAIGAVLAARRRRLLR